MIYVAAYFLTGLAFLLLWRAVAGKRERDTWSLGLQALWVLIWPLTLAAIAVDWVDLGFRR